MKKAYSKPQIMFESFVLSTNIAGDCEEKVSTQSRGSCGLNMSGYTIFMTGMSGCVDQQIDPNPDLGGDGDFNGLCYHVYTDYNLFNS